MRSRIASLLLAAATASMADLSIPFDQVAKDSSKVRAAYGAKVLSNAETNTRLSSDGASLILDVTWGHSVGKDYGAHASILQPLNRNWESANFSYVQAVRFEYKTDAQTTGEFALSSPLYKGEASGASVQVRMVAELAAAADWKTKTISLPDGIAFLKWMTDADTMNGTNYATQTWDDIKTQINGLQFSPLPNYATTSMLGLPATASMSIRNVTVVYDEGVAVDPPLNPKACTGSSALLADFNNANPKQNYSGGWWYAFTDTTSGPVGAANGASKLVTDSASVEGMTFLSGDGNEGGVSGYVGITADLNKMADGTYHPYAGWAAIGTGFTGGGKDIAVDLCPSFSGISFDIVMGGGEGLSFDSANLGGVVFKIGKASVPDSVAWHIGVPYSMNNRKICVDAGALVQPSWYTSARASKPVFTAEDVTKLLWEIRIQNQDATLKATTPTSSKSNSFWVGDIRLWNIWQCHEGISSRKIGGKAALVANYANGLVLSYALEGAASAKVEIVRMDGSKVASFDAPASASAKSFSMNLARGSYLAVVKGGKTSLVAPFAVAK